MTIPKAQNLQSLFGPFVGEESEDHLNLSKSLKFVSIFCLFACYVANVSLPSFCFHNRCLTLNHFAEEYVFLLSFDFKYLIQNQSNIVVEANKLSRCGSAIQQLTGVHRRASSIVFISPFCLFFSELN